MTIAELERAVQSKKRRQKEEAQQQAIYDYILADLIGRSVGRLYSSSARMPELSEAYPALFDSQKMEEEKSAKLAELSALRFKQFAKFHNNKINGGGNLKNE